MWHADDKMLISLLIYFLNTGGGPQPTAQQAELKA